MPEERVAVARYSSPIEANLARMRLAIAGIEASLTNEQAAALSGVPEDGLPIQLEVARTDARGALEVLGQRAEEPAEERTWRNRDVNPERCPICGSSFVEVQQPSISGRILRTLLTSLVPIPASTLESKSRSCGVCRHRWKKQLGETHEPPDPGS